MDKTSLFVRKAGGKPRMNDDYVKQFDQPQLTKNTSLKASKLKDKFFHGLELNKDQIETILIGARATRISSIRSSKRVTGICERI